jgi:hypothetical protein
MSGSGGTILRYRDGTFEKMTTPRDAGTIFGMWGATPDDLWAVGFGGSGGGIVWRYDGISWTEVALPADVPANVFKVHGQASDNVWIAGGSGTTLHWNGTALERVPAETTAPLFSIVTTADDTIAVGGIGGEGQLLENDGTGWTTVGSPQIPVAWRGAAAMGDVVYAVAENGVVARRDAAGWALKEQTLTQLNFHSAWVDPDGGLWGVGGKFDQFPLTADGFLLYYGTQVINEVSP